MHDTDLSFYTDIVSPSAAGLMRALSQDRRQPNVEDSRRAPPGDGIAWIRGRGQLGGITNVVQAGEGARSIRSLLRHHPLRTKDPKQACVFIPMADDTACISNWCKEVGVLHSARFAKLPYWRGSGRDHVIFHFSDH